MPGKKIHSTAGVVVAVAIAMVAALGGYFVKTLKTNSAPAAGQPSMQSAQFSTPNPKSNSNSGAIVSGTGKVDSVEAMAARLRARLQKEPNDVDGWVLLARSYHFLEKWDDAKAAFAKARELGYRENDVDAVDVSAHGGDNMHAAANDDAIFNAIGRVGADENK